MKFKNIFDCSDFGSQELNKDQNMIPVRGHLVLFNQQAGNSHLNYMIYDKIYQDGKSEQIYIFPKRSTVDEKGNIQVSNGVIRGAFIEGIERLNHNELAQCGCQEFKKLLDRASLFFHGVAFPDT